MWAAVPWRGGCVHGGSLHSGSEALCFMCVCRHSSETLQVLENRSGEAGVSQEGQAGKAPVSLLVVLGVRAGEIAGELRGRV